MDQPGIGDVAVIQNQCLKVGQFPEVFPGRLWKLSACEVQEIEVRQGLEMFEAGTGKLRTTTEGKSLQLGHGMEVSQARITYLRLVQTERPQLGEHLQALQACIGD